MKWRPLLFVAAAITGSWSEAGAQTSPDGGVVSRPDRWFVTSVAGGGDTEPSTRMLYMGRDGTVLIAQCAARDGLKTGGWSFMVRRDDWSFEDEFLEGWWSVDSEPLNGPLRWGGSGSLVLLNEDALRDRLQEPVDSQVILRVTRGAREWNVELGVRGLASSVEAFAPACRAT
jgi:hypothetical protein